MIYLVCPDELHVNFTIRPFTVTSSPFLMVQQFNLTRLNFTCI